MKKYNRGQAGVIVLIIILVFISGFVFTAYDYGMFSFWAPKYENVQRKVFENTYSYKRGTIQDLRDYQAAWINDNAEQRKGLVPLIQAAADQIPPSELPPDLADFVNQATGHGGF